MPQTQQLPQIQQLAPSVVNKIAAGEVIERPASVVKELMENSIDAGATRIDVTVEQGGGELVRIADNGCGIAPGELPLAVASHATSKIRSADDLFSVATLGFRGEALASIAEVSRLLLRSRTQHDEAGAELEVTGGLAREVVPCGCSLGTVIEVRSLFYNTPVRRRFLRTPQTEMGHTTEAFTRLALAHPVVHFTLRHQDRTLYDLPPTPDVRDRIASFFGGELADVLIGIESEHGGIRLSGYVANPSHSRSTNRMQYLFLNGRNIRDRALGHALSEAYRGLLLVGRYPICFLRLDMSPQLIDVNVHPTKLEVRFQDSGQVYSHLLGTLRTRFLTVDLTARLQPVGVGAAMGAGGNPASGGAGPIQQDERDDQMRQELVDWVKGELERRGEESGLPATLAPPRQAELDLPAPPRQPLVFNRLDWPAARTWAGTIEVGPETDDDAPPLTAAPHSAPPRRLAALQVHNRYLIAESDEGMVVIDQHALHERILYEQIREKVLAGALESQNLLVPEPVDLLPAESAAVLEEAELLGRLGVKVEPFGGDTVLVLSYPAMLANLGPAEVLRGLADQLLSGGKAPERRDLLDSLLHMISCKAAIKAGDRLSTEEIAALVEQRHLAQDAHHCPHGRPTALVFTRDDLDRQFKRI